MARTGAGTRRSRVKPTGSEAEPAADAAGQGAGIEPQVVEAHGETEVKHGDGVTTQQDVEDTDAATLGSKATESMPEGAHADQPTVSAAPAEQPTVDEADLVSDAPPSLPVAHQADKPRMAPGADAPTLAADVAPPPPPRRGGALGMVLGGVVAAAIGAGATLYLFPHGWQPADTQALQARISALEASGEQVGLSPQDLDNAVAPLTGRLDALEALDGASPPPDLAPIEARLAALESAGTLDAGDVTEALAPLQERLTRIEDGIEARIEAAVAQALVVGLARQEEQAQALDLAQHDLEAAQARLEARAALTELIAAAETGREAAGALVTLDAATDLPPALDAFRDGLPTLGALQESYPAAARAALAAAPVAEESSATDRLIGFLRNQTGARSLAPRDGDDNDAILSRAEARLRGGDLPGAVSEIDTLQDEPAAAMAAWRAQAGARLAALGALADVQARLGSQ